MEDKKKKKVISEKTHIKHMFAKDKEIDFLKKVVNDQRILLDRDRNRKDEHMRSLYELRSYDEIVNDIKQMFHNNLHDINMNINEVRTFMIETCRVVERLEKQFGELSHGSGKKAPRATRKD